MKKNGFTALSTICCLLLCSGTLQAGFFSPSLADSTESTPCKKEKKPKPKPKCEEKPKPCKPKCVVVKPKVVCKKVCETVCCPKIYPSSSRIDPRDSYGVFVEGEALWWKATDDSLYFAQGGFSQLLSATGGGSPANSYNFIGKTIRIKPEYDWGFRVGLGGNLCRDQWDVSATWTRYHTEHTTTAEQTSSTVLGVLWGHEDTSATDAAAFASGHYHLRYDLVEANLGRHFWVGDYFSLHPTFGIRGAWIDQKLNIHYNCFTMGSASKLQPYSLPILDVDIFNKSDFHGGGIGGGLDAFFNLYKGLSLIAKAKVHALYGVFHTKFKENDDFFEPIMIAKDTDNYHNGLYGANFALGLNWNRYFNCDRWNLELHAMWEQTTWFGANQMNHWSHQLHESNMNKMNSNLSLQGITFGGSVHF